MSRCVKKYEEEENNVKYIVEEYDDGAVAKYVKSGLNIESVIDEANLLTNRNAILLDLSTNIEYLVELAELQMEV